MPIITTHSGHRIVVDKETYAWAAQKKWNISPRGYARTWVKTEVSRKHLALHRLVVGAKEGEIVDHINRDKLDNRRKNLRIVSSRVNALNRISTGSSKYKGVAVHKNGWQVYVGGAYVGIFTDERKAALAYDRAAKKFYGKNAVTNKELNLL